MEKSLFFDESHESDLVESIDEFSLREEMTLPASENSKKKNQRQDGFWKSISEKFMSYQNNISKTRRIITVSMDAEFPQNEIDKIAQDFANHVQWSPQPIPKYLQKHFDSNYDPSKIERIEDYSAICHIPSVKGANTEESLKYTTIYPLFNAVVDPLLVNDMWGEVQAVGSKEARNENANPFVKLALEERSI
ncbi:hypothetical protein GLOIN_2v1787049 [Rhizophagus irregularis DAOM 181602=DAOM 197198]|uniref:Uncharacterized protein n=1 Tax=Rhizophagus irregularis (strain DAOM 181602 / DAOM 197198 / MUCL 43194) TaxID=747089 RepID=A0A2P4P6Q4_RHIID|nr:hypothetical protein GLOIN_2v1787049 [Rhizophagus irregularis DAOM 181602=DAOM 197198]POG61079.1 hypothetical protein GLOIN_2v1787049 [Rhizophagus irregularis DAOM 181602=DAOM 197198]|eukprot:XP_025167945.1 hypothetical protein GLOIN_2v1787049 [Rhizophagus irregularis DAOM 181602=DAOM 197198]